MSIFALNSNQPNKSLIMIFTKTTTYFLEDTVQSNEIFCLTVFKFFGFTIYKSFSKKHI